MFQGTALAVKHDIETNPMSLKDKLMIELQQDMRAGRVMYGGHILNAKVSFNSLRNFVIFFTKFSNVVWYSQLVDLPCNIETLKTTDKKNVLQNGGYFSSTEAARKRYLVCVRLDM